MPSGICHPESTQRLNPTSHYVRKEMAGVPSIDKTPLVVLTLKHSGFCNIMVTL